MTFKSPIGERGSEKGAARPSAALRCACGCGKKLPDLKGGRLWAPDCTGAAELRAQRSNDLNRRDYYKPRGWEPADPMWWAKQHPEIRARHGR